MDYTQAFVDLWARGNDLIARLRHAGLLEHNAVHLVRKRIWEIADERPIARWVGLMDRFKKEVLESVDQIIEEYESQDVTWEDVR